MNNAPKHKFDYYEMVTLTTSLVEIIIAETELLKIMKINEISGLQPQKQEIALKLEVHQKALKESQDIKNSLTADQIQNLRKLALEFDVAIRAYQTVLFKAQQVNEAVVKMISDVVREHANRHKGYNHLNGKRSAFNNAPAIKINEQI